MTEGGEEPFSVAGIREIIIHMHKMKGGTLNAPHTCRDLVIRLEHQSRDRCPRPVRGLVSGFFFFFFFKGTNVSVEVRLELLVSVFFLHFEDF